MTDTYEFRYAPPSPLEVLGRSYPRRSLLGVSDRVVIADGPQGPWRVLWSFTPWPADAAGNPCPPEDYVPGHPGAIGGCPPGCTVQHGTLAEEAKFPTIHDRGIDLRELARAAGEHQHGHVSHIHPSVWHKVVDNLEWEHASVFDRVYLIHTEEES